MDIEKILAGLRQERQQVEEAIKALERLARNKERKRGRPPKWMAEIKGQDASHPDSRAKAGMS